MVMRAIETSENKILPPRATDTAECSSCVFPARARNCSAACARPAGLENNRWPSASVWSAPTTWRSGILAETNSAFSCANNAATSPGLSKPDFCWIARSSISAGTASKATPALASSVCRARLCEARISGSFSRHMVIVSASFRKPLPLAVGEKFQHGGRGLLDRAPRHVKLRPTEPSAELPGVGDFVGHRLAVDILIIGGIGAHAQQPVLPDLDQPLRRRMKADDQRLFQCLQLVRQWNARDQRHIRGPDAAVGEIDRGRCLRCAGHTD